MYTLAWDEVHYSSKQFGIWRILFGFYLFFYYLRILPYSEELFSNQGPFSDFGLTLSPSFFPADLLTFDSPVQVSLILIACAFFSLLIMVGFLRRPAAFCLWLLVLWLYNRNPYTDSPEYEFVNWLIFALVFIPTGEAYSLGKKNFQWHMPKYFYWGAWIVLAVAYFYAGSSKFRSHDPNWMNGTAMYYVLVTDNARLQWYGNLFTKIPPILFAPVTWSALGLQTLSPIFVASRRARPWWWLVSTATHVGLLFFVNLAQLTLGMVFFHLFLFDHQWFASLVRWVQCRKNRDGVTKSC